MSGEGAGREILGSSAVLLGYGREGESTHRFLLRRYPNLHIGIADEKQVKPIPEGSGAELHCGQGYLDSLSGYDTVIHTPVIPMHREPVASALAASQRITSATNLFFEHSPGTIIGVTGTKGKSTTSSLIAGILGASGGDVRLAGNIGKPMLDELATATAATIFVLELSSFQLEDLRRGPSFAVLLNIVPEHLDHHGSFEEYCAAKEMITKHQTRNDFLLFNPDFEIPSDIARRSRAQKLQFGGGSSPLAWIDRRLLMGLIDGKAERLAALDELPLRGPGNTQNMLAAVTAGIAFGVGADSIRRAVAGFKPLEHRLEEFGTFGGVTFVNDSLSTIPEALVQALEAFPGRIDTVIAGGFDRGLDYRSVGGALAASKARNLILFPTTGEKIWAALAAVGMPQMRRFDVSTMEEAVARAVAHTKPGCVCLMSPASSSFNLFRDYRERGDRFKAAVRAHHSEDR